VAAAIASTFATSEAAAANRREVVQFAIEFAEIGIGATSPASRQA
jgi:hypothetical protein